MFNTDEPIYKLFDGAIQQSILSFVKIYRLFLYSNNLRLIFVPLQVSKSTLYWYTPDIKRTVLT